MWDIDDGLITKEHKYKQYQRPNPEERNIRRVEILNQRNVFLQYMVHCQCQNDTESDKQFLCPAARRANDAEDHNIHPKDIDDAHHSVTLRPSRSARWRSFPLPVDVRFETWQHAWLSVCSDFPSTHLALLTALRSSSDPAKLP